MRYLHDEAREITAYIRKNDLHLFKCSHNGDLPPIEAEPSLIEEMLKKSETLWGLRLPYYALASKDPETEKMTLEQAVSRVEGVPTPEKFIVAAYQDGGLITVSGVVLPFQVGAPPAQWWWPTSRPAWIARFLDWKKRLNWLH